MKDSMIRRRARLHHGEHAWIEAIDPGGTDQLVGVVSQDPANQTVLVRHQDGREETVDQLTPVIWLYEVGGRWYREDDPELWPHLIVELARIRAKRQSEDREQEPEEVIADLERILRRNDVFED